jgi:hypothetical protein
VIWNTATSAATTAPGTNGTVWNYWCGNAGSTASTTTTGIWYQWVNNSTGNSMPAAANIQQPYYRPEPETAEQKRTREEERRKREEASKAAEEKSKALLLENLNQEQAKQYEKEKKFRLVAPSGKQYEFDCTRKMHNIHHIDQSGGKKTEYCIYLTGDCPLPDNHLAQKLLLEADEPRFLKIANKREFALSPP